MTYTTEKNKFPVRKEGANESKLIVKGQGVFLFKNTDNSKPAILYFYNPDKSDGYTVTIDVSGVKVSRIIDGTNYIDSKNNSGLVNTQGAYYWVSLDAQNQTLRVGIGEARVETIIYDYTFMFESDNDLKTNKLFIETLETVVISSESAIKPVRLLRDPVTSRLPALVKDDLSMDEIAKGVYLPKPNLSLGAQQLYDCISGKNFTLDTSDFPDFVQAIEHSIKTPGLWCNTRLQEKSTEFNKDKPNVLETYLRITLGQNNGESPGIPYVMEIWPVGHYSPVHNHSGANAIIRILNGSINVSQFAYLSTSHLAPFSVANFSKDDITWISANLNQTHQLVNLAENAYTCITVQCYLYEHADKAHYDYFDYIDDDGKRQQYEPDSDMDFVQFKTLMKAEWSKRLVEQKNFCCLRRRRNESR